MALPLVLRALRHAAEEREQVVGKAPQQRDGEGPFGLDSSRGVVFLEDGVEGVVAVVLDAPVGTHDVEPLLGAERSLGKLAA